MERLMYATLGCVLGVALTAALLLSLDPAPPPAAVSPARSAEPVEKLRRENARLNGDVEKLRAALIELRQVNNDVLASNQKLIDDQLSLSLKSLAHELRAESAKPVPLPRGLGWSVNRVQAQFKERDTWTVESTRPLNGGDERRQLLHRRSGVGLVFEGPPDDFNLAHVLCPLAGPRPSEEDLSALAATLAVISVITSRPTEDLDDWLDEQRPHFNEGGDAGPALEDEYGVLSAKLIQPDFAPNIIFELRPPVHRGH